ncbi:MAG: GNAT family N-acetyltransferase [Bacteroidales bacterium]
MIKQVQIGVGQLIYNRELLNLLLHTCDDRFSEEDCIEAISQSQVYLVYKGEVLCGFYTIDPSPESVEAHAYLLKQHRRHSLAVLRHIINLYRCSITTSVYGTHKHVLKFLERVGFLTVDTLKDALLKEGELHDVWILSLSRRP